MSAAETRSAAEGDGVAAFGRLVAIFAVALVWTTLLRWPTLGRISEDEAFFVIVGRDWLAGFPPYAHAWDVKPPGLFLLTAFAEAGFGPTFAAIKALTIVAVAATATTLGGLATRHVSRPVGAWAFFVYPVASLFASGDTMPAILVQAPFVALAFFALFEARRGRAIVRLFLSGLAIGAAGMIKQTAIFEAAALVALAGLWEIGGGGGRGRAVARAIAAIGVGAMVAPLAFAAWFAAQGLFTAFFDGAVIGAAGRLSGDPMVAAGSREMVRLGLFDAIGRLPAQIRPCLGLTVLATLAWMRRRRLAPAIDAAWFPATLVWFAAALAGVVAVKAMYDNYIHTALAPLTLAAGVFVFHGIEIAGRLGRRIGQIAASAAVAAPSLLLPMPLAYEPVDMEGVRAAAAIVRAAGGAGQDELLAPRRGLPLNVETGSFPTVRWVHHMHLMCDLPTSDGVDPLATALAARPRFLAIADPTRAMVCERRDRIDELVRTLADYRSIGTGRGPRDSWEIFERIDRGEGMRGGIGAP
ncbi:MAG: hypothetical protein LWW93_14915 [Hyphomicrobiales bacterium]|nr:hypothetical protein [Hyphomicrobiales bacterium]